MDYEIYVYEAQHKYPIKSVSDKENGLIFDGRKYSIINAVKIYKNRSKKKKVKNIFTQYLFCYEINRMIFHVFTTHIYTVGKCLK